MNSKIWYIIRKKLKGARNFIYDCIIPIKNQVILESAPEFSDNTYYLYLEMLKNNYQKKYKIIWLVTDENINPKFRRNDIYYFNINKKGFLNKFKFNLLLSSSKYIITCNRFYAKKIKKQVVIYLNHGQPLKDCSKLKLHYGDCDASVTSSKFFIEKNASVLDTDVDKFIIFSPPRNDGLLIKNKNIKKLMNLENQKIIVWLPTFRNHSNGQRVDSCFKMPLGIPIIYNINELEKFNAYLKKRNITVILKPHFAANLSEIKAKTFSNFKVIYNNDLDNYGITLYELLGESDALVTDYSSVYYDYLITKKPIGLTLDDYEEYEKKTGFAYDYKEIIKGYYIYNINNYYKFIDKIYENINVNLQERMNVIKKLELDLEGNYSKKLFDYIVKTYKF